MRKRRSPQPLCLGGTEILFDLVPIWSKLRPLRHINGSREAAQTL